VYEEPEPDDDELRRVTMHDVASRAGVALSSVSRALGGHPDVSKKMRRRVIQAANELGYEPNFLAQSLRTGLTQTIGFIVRDITNPFFAAIATGAEKYLRSEGYMMLLVNSGGDPAIEADHIDVLRRRRVDGLILNVVAEDHEPTVNAIIGMNVPTVLVDREISSFEGSRILCDHYTGVRAAVSDLIDAGHERIALVSGRSNVLPVRERIRGLTDESAAHGLDPADAMMSIGGFDDTYAFEEVTSLLDLPEPPTAILAGGVQVTIGTIRALAERGLRPGVDIGFVALDEVDMLAVVQPEVSVVARFPHKVGAEAARLLMAAAHGEPPSSVVIPTEYRPGATPQPGVLPTAQ